MARKTITTLIDDLDGSPADQTVWLRLNDRAVTLDLTDDNAARLEELLTPYLDAGRHERVAKASTQARSRHDEDVAKAENAKIRVWARTNGWPNLSDRGRLPKDAQTAYAAATAGALA